jgi:LysM repeat protein
MKKLIVLLFLVPLFANAQVKTHTVGPKETLYSLAREYNIHPRELAEYNHISVQSSLSIGQVIKIPATRKMAPLPPLPSSGEEKKVITKEPDAVKKKPIKPVGSIIRDPETNKPIGITETITPVGKSTTPIYHKVAPKETLYHISTLYNKVPVADLKKWNHLTGNDLKEGTDLIVGYTKSDVNEISNKPLNAKEEVVVKKAETPMPVAVKETKTVVIEPTTGKNFNGGFFKSFYNEQSQKKSETGKAGIFKSTSGWEDGKYYCLHDTAPAGSIVKITNPANNKSIYAKVLDVMPDLKQNDGLSLRLSNAAADALGAGTDNFDCTINY